jgi:hypothetical protein
MFRKMIATFTAVTAALLVVGVAWASGDDDTSTSVTAAGSSSVTVDSTGTSLDDSTGTSVDDDSGTSTSLDDSTVTSLGDNGTTSTSQDDGTTSTSLDDDDHATVTTIQSTTSTSTGSSTSTSLDDSTLRPADGRSTHDLPGVGSVTIEVRAGVLVLLDVSAPGWSVELDKVEHDRIEIEFTSGESEAEFEARIEGARVDVEIEIDSD